MFGGDYQSKYTEGFIGLLLGNRPYKDHPAIDYTHPTVHYNTL